MRTGHSPTRSSKLSAHGTGPFRAAPPQSALSSRDELPKVGTHGSLETYCAGDRCDIGDRSSSCAGIGSPRSPGVGDRSAGARLLDSLTKAAETIRPVVADLTTAEGREAVASAIGNAPLDLAVHAAGLLGTPNTTLEAYPKSRTGIEYSRPTCRPSTLLHQAVAPAMHRVDDAHAHRGVEFGWAGRGGPGGACMQSRSTPSRVGCRSWRTNGAIAAGCTP